MVLSPEQLQQIANDPAQCVALFKASPALQKIAENFGTQILREELRNHVFNDTSRIEHRVDEATLARLFDMVAAQWRQMGESKPHWSVLSSDEWLPENLTPEKLEAFYASGREEVALLLSVLGQAGLTLPPDAVCLELGCGVGRVTQHLAPHFAQVTAVDISPGNLAVCAQRMREQGLTQVNTALLERPEGLSDLPPADLFFSLMVLQHNPPPIQTDLLMRAARRMKPGGVLYFQVITAGLNYRYQAEAHLARWQETHFEMHPLPIPFLTRALAEAGFRVAHVMRDLAGGFGVDSHTFLAVRI